MNDKKFLFLAGFVLFIFFVLFSYLVHKDLFTRFDFDATVRLQDNINPRYDEFLSLFSDIGNFEPMLLLLVLVLLFRRKITGVIVFALFGVFHVIELYGKLFVEHLPPPEFLLRVKPLVDFPQFHVRSEFSYPSGHAGRTAFLSILLGYFVIRSNKLSKNKKIFIISIIIVYDIFMYASRVHLGEHWASDVIGGFLLGSSLGMISGAVL